MKNKKNAKEIIGSLSILSLLIGASLFISNASYKKEEKTNFSYKEKLNKITSYYNQMNELKLGKSLEETIEGQDYLWNQYYNLNKKADSIYKLLPGDYQKMADSIKFKQFNWDN